MIGLLGGNWGYTDAEGNKVSALRDMTDGGGAGRYGDTFEGGPISGLLNNIGVRPNGYRRRKAAPDRGSVDTPRGAPVAAPNPAMPPLRPVGMNPVTPYDEAARFGSALRSPTDFQYGLLAPEPNVAYEPMYTGRGRTDAFEGPAMPVSEGRMSDPRMAAIYSNLIQQGYSPQEINQAMQRYAGYSVPGAR